MDEEELNEEAFDILVEYGKVRAGKTQTAWRITNLAKRFAASELEKLRRKDDAVVYQIDVIDAIARLEGKP